MVGRGCFIVIFKMAASVPSCVCDEPGDEICENANPNWKAIEDVARMVYNDMSKDDSQDVETFQDIKSRLEKCEALGENYQTMNAQK